MNKKVCGAKLRGKNATCKKSPMANGRCRLHGGKTPSGPDSANYKHGRYASAFQGKLAEKFEKAKADPDPLELMTELNVQRTLLDQYLEDISSKRRLTAGALFNASMLAKDVVKTGATIIAIRNKQALTIAEIKFIQQGMTMLMEKYVPDPDRRRLFFADLRALIPERHGTEEDEPAILSIGAGEAG